MPFVQEHNPSIPDKVFMLATPAHMLHKFHWEIYTLKKTLTNKLENPGHVHAPSYCAFNCAVTAWHILDWVWQSPGANKEDILQQLGMVFADDDKKNFRAFQNGIRQRSRSIHICRQLATGSKHMTVTTHPDITVTAEMRWEVKPAKFGEARFGDPFATHRYHLIVIDNQQERSAVDVFEQAFKDWQYLLGEWGFVEPSFVPGNPMSQKS